MVEIICSLCLGICGFGAGSAFVIIQSRGLLKNNQVAIEELKRQNNILKHWLRMKNNEINVLEYVKERNIKRVYLYGNTDFAELMAVELRNDDIKVCGIIDRRADYIYSKEKLYRLDEDISDAELIINTVTSKHDKIVNDLQGKVYCEIISLDEIIRLK